MIVKLKPYPDELLFSYIHRLADANALSINMFRKKYFNDYSTNRMLYDIRNGFATFANALFPNQNQADKYFELTTAPFEALFMTPQHQSRLISSIFEPYDEINRPIGGFISTIRICPHCAQEDKEKYGEAYLHRAHQLSGVDFCHKHKTRLMEYTGKRGEELNYESEQYKISSVTSISSPEYAQYTYDIFTSGLSTNLKLVQNVLLKTAFERGMYSIKDDQEYFHFPDGPYTKVSKDMLYGSYVSTENIIKFTMYLFPNVYDFLAQFPQQEKIVNEYTCHCGAKYYQSSWGHEQGLKVCPCQPYKNAHEKFVDMVRAIQGDEYEVYGQFISMSDKVLIRHKTCDSLEEYLPRAFLFETTRCICENIVSYKEAQKKIDSISGYKLIKFNGTNQPVTIHNTRCGHTFTCNYHKFLKFQNCRVCHPTEATPKGYEERVRMLVGDEYTIMTPFINQHTKLNIRHNVCGHVQEYTPSSFLAGQRCKECSKLTTHDKLAKYLLQYSKGKYQITHFGKNLVTVQNTETLETTRLSPARIMQEILRPTPSDVLYVENPDKSIHITSAWEDALELFKEYVSLYPASSLTASTRYKDFGLGEWVKKQRMAYNIGGLSADSISQLQAAGFLFDKRNDVWMEKYNLLKDIWGKEPITANTVYNGVLIGTWLKNQKMAFTRGQLSWDKIDLMQQIDRNILQTSSNKGMDPFNRKHIRVLYDKKSETILVQSTSYLHLSTFDKMPVKWVYIDTLPYLQFDPKKATKIDFDRLLKYFQKNKYAILIRTEDFYELTKIPAINAPDKYHPDWHIDNGVMYTTHPSIVEFILSPQPYQ